MPTKKQEKRRRKLRVHGPSADAVGAPPTGRKEPRPTADAGADARARREPAVPSLKRSARKGGFMGLFMVAIVVVTTRGHGASAMAIALLETIPLVFLFVVFDLWMARKVYKRVTGREAPRPEKTPRAEKASRAEEAEPATAVRPRASCGVRERQTERDGRRLSPRPLSRPITALVRR